MKATAEMPRRHLSDRQRELVDRLVAAAQAEVEDRGYDEVTVRGIARRAGVAPATAYTYFSSKDHVLGELFWRRMLALPPALVDLGRPGPERVAAAVDEKGLGIADSPAVVAACTAALLGGGPDVAHLRTQIAGEFHRRLAAALGPGADHDVLGVLDLVYVGALLSAGMGHLDFAELPGRLGEAAALLTGDGPGR